MIVLADTNIILDVKELAERYFCKKAGTRYNDRKEY